MTETAQEGLVAVPEDVRPASLCGEAMLVKVTNAETYTNAAELLKRLKGRIKAVKDLCGPNKKRWDEGHKAAVKQEKELLAPYESAVAHINPQLSAWDQEQERIRQERERKLREEAALLEAEQAEAEGDNERAQDILDNGPTAAITIESSVPKVAGMSYRDNWKAEVISIKELARAVADGSAAENLLLPNQPALNQIARALRENMRVPGVRAVKERVVASGRA